MTPKQPKNRRIQIARFVAVLAFVAVWLTVMGCETNNSQSQNANEEQSRQARIEAVERLRTNTDSIQKEIRMYIGRYKEVRNVGRIVLSPTDARVLGQTQIGQKLSMKAQEEITAFVVQKYAEVGINIRPLRVALTFIPYRDNAR